MYVVNLITLNSILDELKKNKNNYFQETKGFKVKAETY